MINGTRTAMYLGPPKGLYEQTSFHDFVTTQVVQGLEKVGFPGKCNPEAGDRKTTYHFPDAGVGIEYRILSPQRCLVTLLAAPKKDLEAKAVEMTILNEDNREF